LHSGVTLGFEITV